MDGMLLGSHYERTPGQSACPIVGRLIAAQAPGNALLVASPRGDTVLPARFGECLTSAA